ETIQLQVSQFSLRGEFRPDGFPCELKNSQISPNERSLQSQSRNGAIGTVTIAIEDPTWRRPPPRKILSANVRRRKISKNSPRIESVSKELNKPDRYIVRVISEPTGYC
ncbi:unnamed protein product, partial [Heterotrigona itama]